MSPEKFEDEPVGGNDEELLVAVHVFKGFRL
jgi:hypothetical protein